MNAVYAIAILIGLAGILFAVINMIYPFKRLGIPTRKRGALVLAASFSLVIVAGVLIDQAKQTDQSEAIQPPPSAVDDEANTAADNRAPKTANSVTAADPGPEESSRTGVVTDRFTLQWELDGTDLLLAIDTDLPDTAEVILFVDRRYYQVGDADAYSRDYFKEKVPISKWRSPRRIPLDDDAWKTDLTTHQSKMAVLGNDLAFEIDRIEDQIGVRALVHVNQPDQRFGGRGNPNLSGGAVSRTGDNSDWNIIKAGIQIPLPLAGDMPASATDSAPSQPKQSEAIQPPPSAVDDEANTAADNRAPKTANSVTAADPGPEESSRTGVVTDRFTLQWELDGTDLLLAIDTDLPDTAEVIVFVDRRYYQVGDADAYSRDYFKEKVPISKWRSPRRIPLDDDAWKTDLTTHQSKMAVLGNDLAFEIDRIEDQIGVRALVHVNQPDQRFGGRGNPNLSGGAVSRTGDNSDWNIIKAGIQIPLPLAGDMPASATDSAPSQPKQGVRTDSSSTSRNTIDSRVYTVADEKDHSFGNVRSRVTLEIEARGATTERAQMETMMKAAVERHRKDWPDAVSVRLWGSYGADQAITNSIDYAADGCGWTGDDCTGSIWAKPHKGNVPAELTEWGTPTDGEREAGKDLQCRQDLQCWGDKHLLKATFACQPMIENLAKYDYEWTDGWLEAKLQRFRWKDRKIGTLSYTGNKVKFQNGFGAWQRITYWCHFDPATGFSEVSVQ